MVQLGAELHARGISYGLCAPPIFYFPQFLSLVPHIHHGWICFLCSDKCQRRREGLSRTAVRQPRTTQAMAVVWLWRFGGLFGSNTGAPMQILVRNLRYKTARVSYWGYHLNMACSAPQLLGAELGAVRRCSWYASRIPKFPN